MAEKITWKKSKCCKTCKHFKTEKDEFPNSQIDHYLCGKHNINLDDALQELVEKGDYMYPIATVDDTYCEDWTNPENLYFEKIMQKIESLSKIQEDINHWEFAIMILEAQKEYSVAELFKDIISAATEKFQESLGVYLFEDTIKECESKRSFTKRVISLNSDILDQFKQSYELSNGHEKKIYLICLDPLGAEMIPHIRSYLRQGKEPGVGIFLINRGCGYIDSFLTRNAAIF